MNPGGDGLLPYSWRNDLLNYSWLNGLLNYSWFNDLLHYSWFIDLLPYSDAPPGWLYHPITQQVAKAGVPAPSPAQ